MKKILTMFLSFVLAVFVCVASVLGSDVVCEDAYYSMDEYTGARHTNVAGISAKAAVLIDAVSGRVIYSRNQDTRMPMASTTKIMTALLALEQDNLDEYFVVDPNAIMVEGSSMGLTVGAQVTMRTLAYGMLLPSGNDAANAAAVRISGNIPDFTARMNQRAAQIGMTNTNFVTPSGLDGEGHYSTAYDMALLAQTAIQNADFRYICSQPNARVEFGNPPARRWMRNHNRLLGQYDGVFGVKTGFTKKSGRCLVTAAERDGVVLIAVTLSAHSDWADHKAMYDYGFSSVTQTPLTIDTTEFLAKVTGGLQDEFKIKPFGDLLTTLTDQEKQELTHTINLREFYYAPVNTGDVAGEIEFLYKGKSVGTIPLIAAEAVERHITEVKPGLRERILNWFKRKNNG
ncbi:MAG: D-alanyl-D-alanine carboxypeptidase [Oscillospiraceae bacterium]|nr:D-alanyl-D-alanine carboxypeptidase [Oscillospiraceae bacterium]